jgi:hypothetical protein
MYKSSRHTWQQLASSLQVVATTVARSARSECSAA